MCVGVYQGHKTDKNFPEIKSAFLKNTCGVFLTFSFSQCKNDRVGEKRKRKKNITS